MDVKTKACGIGSTAYSEKKIKFSGVAMGAIPRSLKPLEIKRRCMQLVRIAKPIIFLMKFRFITTAYMPMTPSKALVINVANISLLRQKQNN